MSTNTIILLVLGLIILGVLAFGFTTGWNMFKAEMQKSNVDQIKEECATTCSLNQEFSFCSGDKVLRFTEEQLEYKTSCRVYAELSEFSRFGVDECPRISCDVSCENIRIDDLAGEKATEAKDGYFDVTTFANNIPEGEFCLIKQK